ncbi:hypothetical protein BHM03_00008018 [Ensete ventricosum]|uniref:Uncharacterized protein n=1 Tax=Ensete ventricosum TaxID=4639 RepID=A0A426YK69_ENSVE|nr:hypothetical protein B296_00050638 [Ensete ventricosum]RZR81724.1 hypothetical protein BHM03_00008018 [Ensete ventricosum]
MLNERKRPKGTTKEEIQWKDGSPAEELLIDDGRDVEEGIPHPQKHPFAGHFPLPSKRTRARQRARRRGAKWKCARGKCREAMIYRGADDEVGDRRFWMLPNHPGSELGW